MTNKNVSKSLITWCSSHQDSYIPKFWAASSTYLLRFSRGINFADDKFLKILRGLYFAVTQHKIIRKALSMFYNALLIHFISLSREKKHEISLNQLLPPTYVFQPNIPTD